MLIILKHMSRYMSFSNNTAASYKLLLPEEIEMLLNPDLIERRNSVRTIPCPDAVELYDDATWTTWNALMARQEEFALP